MAPSCFHFLSILNLGDKYVPLSIWKPELCSLYEKKLARERKGDSKTKNYLYTPCTLRVCISYNQARRLYSANLY
jgi:hypothetical protein